MHTTLTLGDLTAIIGDNSAHGEHRAGYNGVWSLTHRTEKENLFVPAVAGLNLEHIMDGDRELRDVGANRKVFFEPRNSPMTLKQLSDTAAELHQEPTPTFHVESWTRFQLVAPHYLDMTFRCKPTQHVFTHEWMGLFWASYINAPEDKSMYLRGQGQWLQLCTPMHNDKSTVVHRADDFKLKFTDGLGDALFKNLSAFRHDLPLFYGLFGKHIFIVMFDRTAGLRLTHSPSGGGFNRERETSNPAWDFQFIVPKPEVLKEYGFRARVVYRERCDRAEVLREYEGWRAMQR
jgi:hypothetical protein